MRPIRIRIMNHSGKLSDKVSEQIRQDIKIGKYKPAEKIPAEPELMELYGVGRSTIREAVKSLAMSGVLKVQQGSGTFVNDGAIMEKESIDQRLKRADFEEINSVRRLMETELVKLAALHHQQNHILEIENRLAQRKQAIHTEQQQECIDADIAFHKAIAAASGNGVLADLYDSFTRIIRQFFSEREKSGISHFAMSHHLHEQLFKTIKAGKPKQAQQILEQILDKNY